MEKEIEEHIKKSRKNGLMSSFVEKTDCPKCGHKGMILEGINDTELFYKCLCGYDEETEEDM